MIQDTIAKNIELKMKFLKQIDSLKIQNQLDKLKYQIDTQNSIATEVNNFYDSAWLKLIIVITILGIALPIIIQYFQRKNYKELAENLRNSFDDKLDILKENNELRIDKIVNEYKTNLKELETKNDMVMFEIDANTYYLQGRSLMLERSFIPAVFSYLKAILTLKKCNRVDRIIPNLNNLKRALTNVEPDKMDILDRVLQTKLENNFESLIDEIEKEISADSTILIKTSELKTIYLNKKTMPNTV
ncbi:hypothetical protein G1K75_12385 [Tenacibaculum finnmarkense]|uniref:hypothetical protein n=1 Tax=Tenacibaculum finnmarkense TaxID=2781243 RepID=UPI001EFC2652|nr:hypothetical protein [Tenacibaculum finnmarkense]MCG8806449.1 hypothetical protein [Tenacibaculum finnmarkense]MCG8857560.1 hypothetical protein [Tenacibaculum finnmarkense]